MLYVCFVLLLRVRKLGVPDTTVEMSFDGWTRGKAMVLEIQVSRQAIDEVS